MKRIGKCLVFELKYLGKGALAFLGYYFGFYVVLGGLIAVSNTQGGSSSTNGTFFIAGSIFIFAYITASYKSLMNNLMMFGNTRKSIVFSSYVAYFCLSVAIGIIAMFSMFVDRSLTLVSGNTKGVDIFNIIYPGGANAATEFLWFVAFFILVSAFAMLYGSLSYKFGKTFRWVFWIALSFIFILGANNIGFALKNFFCIGSPNGILVAPVYFILAAVVFGAGAFLSAVRQPQNV